MQLKDIWFKIRHRRNRKDAGAFLLGMEVGRVLSVEQQIKLGKRVRDNY